jgi:hypothetical protein
MSQKQAKSSHLNNQVDFYYSFEDNCSMDLISLD